MFIGLEQWMAAYCVKWHEGNTHRLSAKLLIINVGEVAEWPNAAVC